MFTRFNKVPDAYADFPDIEGTVTFYGVHGGTVVVVNLRNLPTGNQFHALHIHAGDSCTGTQEEPFKNADGHYNPTNMPHPNHVGDYLQYYPQMEWPFLYSTPIVFIRKM